MMCGHIMSNTPCEVRYAMTQLNKLCAIVIITILYRSDEIHDSSPSKEISFTIHSITITQIKFFC